MKWLGIDVGGANLKLADGEGFACSQPFPLWQCHHDLVAELRHLLTESPPADGIAATMTGELCDCYETKTDGVRHIVEALQHVADGRPLAIYCVDGQFRPATATLKWPILAAASNWHALARLASRWMPDNTGILIDIGSTTTDIIPVRAGQIATSSKTDMERLLAEELVYTGIGRTPIAAIVDAVPYRGRSCPVAAELFATTADVYFLLGEDSETSPPSAERTADDRAMTTTCAVARLARMICADREHFTLEDAIRVARYVRSTQLSRLRDALGRVTARHSDTACAYVVSGIGEFLARDVVTEPRDAIQYLSQLVGRRVSGSAAAHAVAVLASEGLAGWTE